MIEKIQKIVFDSAFSLDENLNISDIVIEYPNDNSHGDYACNIAMRLTKKLSRNPREIAEEVISNIKSDLFEKIEIAGPGFINFWISEKVLQENTKKILNNDDYGKSDSGKDQTIIIDMSAPNIAKPMNVGHLRSTIIGDSIKRIYTKLGFNVIGDNHIGDWGTQFGKLIHAFKTWGDKEIIEKNPIPELLKLYVKFHDEAEKDDDLNEKGRQEFSKLEKGDQENRELWKWFVDESMQEFEKIYKKIGVTIEETWGESFYEEMLPGVIETLLEKEVADRNEDGSLAVDFEKYDDPEVKKLPSCLVQKKDGSTLYLTRDIAKIKFICDRFNAKKSIYVVGNEQSLNFKQLFAIARILGYDLDLAHVPFGLVRLKDGKLSTRKGRVIYLEDVIKEAEERVSKILKERDVGFDDDEMEKLVHILSIGAIKYNDLSQNRMTEIVFDWDKMLSFEGNSAPYIQYTYARSMSILRKAGGDIKIDCTKFTDECELNVARMLLKFPDYIKMAGEEYKPNILATYLFELTQQFNTFYNKVQVLNIDDESVKLSRLSLVQSVAKTIKIGLDLLGIDVPERM